MPTTHPRHPLRIPQKLTRLEKLSRAQRLLASGTTKRAMARKLGITPKSVEKWMRKVKRFTGCAIERKGKGPNATHRLTPSSAGPRGLSLADAFVAKSCLLHPPPGLADAGTKSAELWERFEATLPPRIRDQLERLEGRAVCDRSVAMMLRPHSHAEAITLDRVLGAIADAEVVEIQRIAADDPRDRADRAPHQARRLPPAERFVLHGILLVSPTKRFVIASRIDHHAHTPRELIRLPVSDIVGIEPLHSNAPHDQVSREELREVFTAIRKAPVSSKNRCDDPYPIRVKRAK